MQKELLFLFAALTTANLCGCTPDSATAAQNCPGWEDNRKAGDTPDTTTPTRTIDVAACAGGLTQADIDASLEIVDFMKDDFGEMNTCGMFSRNAAFSLSHFFAALSCGNPSYPSGITYQGSGYYMVGQVMGMQAKLTKDTSFGKAGDDLAFDVFDPNNYWQSAGIKATLSADVSWSTDGDVGAHLTGTIEITPSKPKKEPFELWGIPAEDGKPITAQQEDLAKAIGEGVMFVSDIDFSPQTVESHHGTKYTVGAPDTKVGALYAGQPMAFQIVSVEAPPNMQNQTTSIVDWSMAFIPVQSGVLDGSFTLKIDGGKFPYYVRYTYPHRLEPDVLVTCTAPPPMP